jgi:hypothetical protein
VTWGPLLRRKPETMTKRCQLNIDLIVPLPYGVTEKLTTRIVVVGLTRFERAHHRQPWEAVGCRYLVGTPDAFFVEGLDFPLSFFEPVSYESVTNPYQAANRYVQHMSMRIQREYPSMTIWKRIVIQRKSPVPKQNAL